MIGELPGRDGAGVLERGERTTVEASIPTPATPSPNEPGEPRPLVAARSPGAGRSGPARWLMSLVPPRVLGWYRTARHGRNAVPPVGGIRFGSFHRRPFSRWGYRRGTPIDRRYIEQFLAANRSDITGDVLEFGDPTYTRRFGVGDLRSHVLHVMEGGPDATIVADITRPDTLPAESFDCIVCTQTLQQLYDVPTALRNLNRSLRSGGVMLATVPCISQIDRSAMARWGDYWRFTALAVQRLVSESFPAGAVTITEHGNVLAASAFLYGVAAEELDPDDLDHADPDYPMLITVRAWKP